MIETFCIQDGKTYDITSLIESVEIKGSKYRAPRTATYQLLNTNKGMHSAFNFKEGSMLIFKWNKKELHRGILFKDGKSKGGNNQLTVHDFLVYMLKNDDSYVFTRKKASEITSILCNDFQIPIGNIVDTGFVIPSLVIDNKCLYDIVLNALEQTRKQTGQRHYFYSNQGKIYLIKRKEQYRKWVIENGVNLIDYSFESSIENTITKVKLVTEENKKTLIATVGNGDLQKRFGILQHYEKVNDKLNYSQLTARAKQILNNKSKVNRQFSITALGLPDVISGTAIYVFENELGIKKGFYVDEDSHTFKGNEHLMSLKLTETDDLPEVS